METRARLVLHDAGFPEPEVGGAVYAAGGGWLAEGDLVWRAPRVIGEYQGEVHGSRAARSADAYRQGCSATRGGPFWSCSARTCPDVTDGSRCSAASPAPWAWTPEPSASREAAVQMR
ncbi:hypothetical protein [uncultured Phycicoccus sp.]|uniref:hypothetical protein n=1 Tax=uncultured Phycicoccus sp. TaxID=661422 RepID=UPI0026339F04|nr:hypothetical protein [uncultured Phycicoccus sp.]